MSSVEVQGPPQKKRRFFVESPIDDESPPQLAHLPQSGPNGGQNGQRDHADGLHRAESAEQSLRAQDRNIEGLATSPAKDGELDFGTIEVLLGEKLEPATYRRLHDVSGGDLTRAVNMYFDGSWETAAQWPSRPKGTLAAHMTTLPERKSENTSSCAKAGPQPVDQPQRLNTMPERRYIGAFGVSAWTTKSGSGLVKIGEAVRIERTKIKLPVKIGRGGKVIQPPKLSAARSRTDVIVRFTNSKGEEIGRLPKETADWVSTLMDQGICHFDGLCFYAPDRVRVNDTVELQLKCCLLRRAFESSNFVKPRDDNRTTGIFEEKETSEEKDLRLRQIAMVKLFDEIKLNPTTTNDTTASRNRQSILAAAEGADQAENAPEPPKTASSPNGTSSPPEEEQEDGKELEQDQLDSLYKKAQSFDFNTPVQEPSSTFTMDLRKYQKQALYWMMSKEKDEKADPKEVSMHPLWEEYAWPVKDVDGEQLIAVADQDTFYVNPYSGEMSLDFPAQEQHCLGGILADEMGLGKTIEMLSLMHTHRSDVVTDSASSGPPSVFDLPRLPKTSTAVLPAPATTLVVAPMSLLSQWESEAAKASTSGSLKTMVYYGNEKAANLQSLCCEANAASAPNLIITSYGVVLSEFNQVAHRGGDRGSHGGLFSLDFFRVILDEAHFIKNRQSKTAKACYEIAAQHRWVLTGTPIVNRLEDLFSLVHFLKVEPWANFSFWKTFITVPFESKDFIRALDVVQTVLEPLVMRRTKDMRTPDGEALVPLPARTIEIEEIELSKQEREVYDYIFTRAKRAFNANMEAGTVLKSYTTIFAQILRLRQSCCHPVLTRNKAIAAEEEEAAAAADVANGLADDMDLQELIERFTSDSDGSDQDITNRYGANVLHEIQSQVHNECPICSEEPMIEAAVTGCWHSACKQCLLDYIEHQKDQHTLPLCFNCRAPINQRDLFEIVHHDDDVVELDADDEGAAHNTAISTNTPPRISLRRIGTTSSAKIAALTSHLKALRKDKPGTKVVVFSQFTSFLDLIATAFATTHIPYLRFDGAMSQKSRANVLGQFASASATKGGYGTVLLLSLRAGGVGLNLTCASRVFMMDPWWSFAVEAQAIDRVHRMGQDEEVKVVRFVVEGSIEQRMLKVQDRKKFIASSLGMMSEEEKKMQRIEDIKELLS